MAVTKRQNTKLSSSTATPAPNASSIWIELVAAVKVFEIEERREIAAGHALARDGSDQLDPDGAGIWCRCGSMAVEDESFVFCLFVTLSRRLSKLQTS